MINIDDKGGDLYLGVEIGGTKLQICVGDRSAQILERLRFTVDKSAGASGIRSQLEQVIPVLVKRIKPKALGVGFGGPVDWQRGRIGRSHQIEGWSEFDLGAWLSQLAHAPVRADNDANLGALGEAKCGAGVNYQKIFYVTLGSGVGGGFVTNGQVYHGAIPGESEIGHVRLDRSGTIVEERCSGWAVDARLRAAAAKNPEGSLAKCIGGASANEAKFLLTALGEKEPAAEKILEETADDLAFGLSHVTHLFHPEAIVLGGGLSLIGEPLRVAVQNALRRYVMKAFSAPPQIMLSQLREDAVPVGALCLAQSQ